MYIAILGRQPVLGMAELERIYGAENTRWFSDQTAIIDRNTFSIEHLGGTQKAGRIIFQSSQGDWRRISMKIVQHYSKEWTNADNKITLGISAYGFDISPKEVQKTGIVLKQKLKKVNVSLRLIPNADTVLNSATSHHNKLGLSDNKKELLVVRSKNGRVVIAESIGAQNITAYTKRDQGRPKRDAFVGMLPPKLAQIIVNLAIPSDQPTGRRPILLDPFCGTGVVLQEAFLMGYDVYGTDLSEKMIDYSKENMKWLTASHRLASTITIEQGDAMNKKWHSPIDAVACEAYLGQPFSAPPSPAKLEQVKKNCLYILSSFLENLSDQIVQGTPLCIAIPAWRDQKGTFTHLSLTKVLERFGYKAYEFKHVDKKELLYFRENQIVARELLVLVKS